MPARTPEGRITRASKGEKFKDLDKHRLEATFA
jgi:hypothetical protein